VLSAPFPKVAPLRSAKLSRNWNASSTSNSAILKNKDSNIIFARVNKTGERAGVSHRYPLNDFNSEKLPTGQKWNSGCLSFPRHSTLVRVIAMAAPAAGVELGSTEKGNLCHPYA
jgi:hypothetical protein